MTSTASRPIIDADLVLLDVDAGADKQAVIGRLVGRLADAGRTSRPRRPDRRRDGPRRAVGHRAARRHRDPALPLAARRHGLDRVRAVGAARRLRRTRRPGGSGVPDRGARSRRRRAHEAVVQPGPRTGAQGVRAVAARGVHPRRGGRARRRGAQPRRDAEAGACGREAGRREAENPCRDHRMPDRHRAHLHGRRLAGRRGQRGRRHAARRNAGLIGQHTAVRGHHRRRRRRHLRHRCRCQGQAAVRRQAGRGLGRQARDQRTGQDGRRSACGRKQSERRPGRGLGQASQPRAQ